MEAYAATGGTSALVRGSQPVTTNSVPKYRTPTDYLDNAVGQQHLQTSPLGGFKQKWTEGGYRFEVRIHPADPTHGKSGSVYRVGRQVVPSVSDTKRQGSGLEYIDQTGVWHSEKTLKPGPVSNPNPTFNKAAAESTHIQLPRK